jgi:hypothetical protein
MCTSGVAPTHLRCDYKEVGFRGRLSMIGAAVVLERALLDSPVRLFMSAVGEQRCESIR